MNLGASYNEKTNTTRFIGDSAVMNEVILKVLDLKSKYPSAKAFTKKWGDKGNPQRVDL